MLGFFSRNIKYSKLGEMFSESLDDKNDNGNEYNIDEFCELSMGYLKSLLRLLF